MYSRDTWRYERGILTRQPPLRVSIFVDGANMYYAQKRLGWFIDFRKVLHFFGAAQNNVISEAYYYTGADSATLARDIPVSRVPDVFRATSCARKTSNSD